MLDKELLAFRLKKRVGFWMHKLKTLILHGFNAELNFPNPEHFCIFLYKHLLEGLIQKGLL